MALLNVDKLSVHFGDESAPFRAVDRISYSVKQGEVVGIVGESGSGKSVSSLAIMGLIDYPGRVMAEKLEFNGQDLQRISEKERRNLVGAEVAMIFQDPMTSLNPCYTVGFQIMEAIKVHQGGNKSTRRQRAIDLLNQVGIPDPASRLDVYPHQLSGGMSQRVMIAMAIACRPKLLIADEPTTALDVTIQAQVLELTERVLHRLDARKRLHEMMHREGSELVIGSRRHDLSRYRHVYAFSSGKAGNHMARAFEDLLGEYLTLGVTIIKLRDEEDVYRKTEVYVGGHPLPNEEGIRGCQRMIDIAEQMGPDDLLLLGLTGGCSALMGYPVEGTTLEDLQEATDVMLKAGMWVMDINDIRGHLSRMSRGRLGSTSTGPRSSASRSGTPWGWMISPITRSRYPLWGPLWATTL